MSTFLQPIFWHWFILAVILITLEIVLPTTYLLWTGIGAFTTGVVIWLVPELSWQIQLVLFTVFSVISIVAGRAWVANRPIKTDQPLLNRRGEQYIGRTLTLEEAIINGFGHVSLDDTRWRIEGEDLPAGTQIVVTGVDGNSLKVKASDTGST